MGNKIEKGKVMKKMDTNDEIPSYCADKKPAFDEMNRIGFKNYKYIGNRTDVRESIPFAKAIRISEDNIQDLRAFFGGSIIRPWDTYNDVRTNEVLVVCMNEIFLKGEIGDVVYIGAYKNVVYSKGVCVDDYQKFIEEFEPTNKSKHI